MKHRPPNILIIGAGAIGCTLAWHLSGANAHITFWARGTAQQAITQNGVTLYKDGILQGTRAIKTASDFPVNMAWDAIFICVKQYDLAQTLVSLQHIKRDSTAIIPLVNGIPWWLLQTHEKLRGEAPETWGNAYASYPQIDLDCVVGGVIHIPAQMRDACTVEQGSRNTLVLGELDGAMSERLTQLVATINQSDLQCKCSTHIQHDLWNKLLGNTVFNPVSALASATMHQMLHEANLRALCARLIAEVMSIGNALGYPQDISVEQRLQQAESAGNVRTSMLQDALAGKRIEGETLVGVVAQIARCADVQAPTLNSIWALLQSRFMRAC
ncbi:MULTISPECIES: ketopantoate reductase family protein [Comamonas]|uniref:ketopantoate reductase family protein n=1 Tax=Comamonas TaxID=283 RepID=UPI0005102B7A|nr:MULTISPECIES: 2-dehydropantoate 2-reductase [Comamonas]KGG85089.1 hypothetical protein P369_21300 [Comamonas thiooxydans]KGG95230.1 hypothetical protein P367_21940 [Comamonas thiooxydans]KGG96835.1 hypothetical protein P365_24825 [Comamonas thiooxydans]KGH06212.1 hypothetical protein P368_22730 [Comamonas thiooxydans]TZG08201.1 2-dehydropantoate 2-reductase [Comamonas thiooxydans]